MQIKGIEMDSKQVISSESNQIKSLESNEVIEVMGITELEQRYEYGQGDIYICNYTWN